VPVELTPEGVAARGRLVAASQAVFGSDLAD
jgi:hypothetical protein